ncbi:MAG: hypothetical protein LC687_07330 [Actinobacteria bacterium]|nr:hypothetical protein [Actinomycetota bacterium]
MSVNEFLKIPTTVCYSGRVMNEETNPLPREDKLAFDSKKQAEATALTASWQHGTKMTPYKCKHCGLWHLSSRALSD